MNTGAIFDPYAPIQIGPNRFRTPEGFLVCVGVPIARTGAMLYHVSDELPVEANPDGSIIITRSEEDLFHPHTIASFVGKALIDDHPDVDITPTNWRTFVIEGRVGGHILSVYRGEDDRADELLADLMFTDAALISEVDAGKREVSCGYDAHYVQTAPGMGRQTDIIGNHLAIVERGRCGPRCSIGDSVSTPKEITMSKPVVKPPVAARVSFKDRIRQAFKDAEEKLLKEAEGESGEAATVDAAGEGELAETPGSGESHVHVHLHNTGAAATDDDAPPVDPYDARCTIIEKAVADLGTKFDSFAASMTPAASTGDAATDEPVDPDEEDPKEKAKTKDSAAMETVFKSVVAQAEILAPGISFPTFDATAKRKATVDSLCQLRRKALDIAISTRDGIEAVQLVSAGKTPDVKTLDCTATAMLFKSAANARGMLNNRASTNDARNTPIEPTLVNASKALSTPAQLNEFARKHYAKA